MTYPDATQPNGCPSLKRPGLPAFAANGSILILELAAERIIAPHVGVSLYTWTGIIGVVLAGMSLGYFVGGRLADRWPSRRLLGGVFVLGGLLALIILAGAEWQGFSAPNLPLIPRILLVMVALFFAPSAALGTVTPIVVRLVLVDTSSAGRSIGGIYAAATAGSIGGTLLTGFVLVPLLDTHLIVVCVAALLTAIGVSLIVGDRCSSARESEERPAMPGEGAA